MMSPCLHHRGLLKGRAIIRHPNHVLKHGAPQGCVLRSFLYTLYTNDCISPSPTVTYVKYSDDTPILALRSDTNSTLDDQNTVTHFTHWCTDNHLYVNVNKTKQIVFRPPLTSVPCHHRQPVSGNCGQF